MAIRLTETFESYPLGVTDALYQKWTGAYFNQFIDNSNPWWSIESGNARTGSKCLLFEAGTGSSSGIGLFVTFDDQDTWVIGFGIQLIRNPGVDVFDPDQSYDLVGVYDAGGAQIVVGLRADGKLQLDFGRHSLTGNTKLAEGRCAITNTKWYYIELKVKISPTDGIVIVRIDDEYEMGFAGDTDSTGGGTANMIMFFHSGNILDKGKYRIDDLYICDGTGSRFNDFLGRYTALRAIYPESDVIASWTPSVGSDRFAMVDETEVDTTTYNQTTTTSLRDIFEMSNLTNTQVQSIVLAVAQYTNGAVSNVGRGTLQPIYRHLGNEYIGNSFSIFGSFQYGRQIYELNPITGTSFSVGDVTSMQLGYRLS